MQNRKNLFQLKKFLSFQILNTFGAGNLYFIDFANPYWMTPLVEYCTKISTIHDNEAHC